MHVNLGNPDKAIEPARKKVVAIKTQICIGVAVTV